MVQFGGDLRLVVLVGGFRGEAGGGGNPIIAGQQGGSRFEPKQQDLKLLGSGGFDQVLRRREASGGRTYRGFGQAAVDFHGRRMPAASRVT